MNTIHLQGIGSKKATEAANLVAGQVVVFNYGISRIVTSVVKASANFVKVSLDDGSFFRAKNTKLIGVN